MWKCGFRRLKDTAERGVNHYDKYNPSHTPCSRYFDHVEKKNNSPLSWFFAKKCLKTANNENDTKNKRWNFEHLNRSWIGAIAWSSALVFSWYTSQIIHLKIKSQCKDNNKFCVPKLQNLFLTSFCTNHPDKKFKSLDITREIGQFIKTPIVHVVSYDPDEVTHKENSKSWNTSTSSSDNDLGEVLNSIENRLGLAAIENGQHKEGLNLLRSAANRNHAPAIYNLGLCYELGLGVAMDEKVAMEFYKTAAVLHHPKALYNLGIYYGQGRGGLPKDIVTATRLLKLAAVQGQRDAVSALKLLEESPDTRFPNENMFMEKSNAVPTHSALFVENIQIPQASNYMYEPKVF